MHIKLTAKDYAVAMLALAMTASLQAQATEVYKWTDENGVVHFSDMKPADTDSQNLEVDDRTGFSKAVEAAPRMNTAQATEEAAVEEQELTAAQQRRNEIAQARDAVRLERLEKQQWCDKHRKRLIEMEPARRVYTYDEDGEQVRMDDDTRVALIEESRNYLAENCP
ncbi:MAG: DUF4124 domain-containing protein [Gammaproteobacteria bacterium]|nr:DUF4124 domain-containing protein [Gammaproteobacteria bacterium]